MQLHDIQRQVDEYTKQFDPQYWTPHQILANLIEEVGELGKEINHLHGPKPKKSTEDLKDLGMEIGDIIFTLCCLANSKGINLDDAFKRTMDKYYGRDANRFQMAKT